MNTEKDIFDMLTQTQRVLLDLICVTELVTLIIVMVILWSYC